MSTELSETLITTAAATLAATTDLITDPAPADVESSFVFYIVSLLFGHVPYSLYRLLSYTVTATITLDFWGIVWLTFLSIIISLLVFRQQFSSDYDKLEATTTVPRNVFDLKPDSTLAESIEQSNGYPDDFMNAFLSSIKVFGYLDRPVFQELSRHLQTRKLKAGDILFDSDSTDRDFYVVVEGKVQIFIKTPMDDPVEVGEESESGSNPDWNGHHLLNEVKPGGTVSSLFSILSILSDHMKLPEPLVKESTDSQTTSETEHASDTHSHLTHDEDDNTDVGLSMEAADELKPLVTSDLPEKTPSPLSGSETPNATRMGFSGKSFPINTTDPEEGDADEFETNMTPSIQSDSTKNFEGSKPPLGKPQPPKVEPAEPRSVYPGLIARATCSTTLAAQAFRKVTAKYPKAAAHMVQVILTRFQRVTFLTLHRYLGLSKELLAIEHKVNEMAGAGLPTDLFPPSVIHDLTWKLSHQYSGSRLDRDFPLKTSGSPLSRQTLRPRLERDFPVSPLSHAGSHKPSDLGVNAGLHDPHAFETGDSDEKLKDAIFNAIAHIIGLTPTEPLHVTEPHKDGHRKKAASLSTQSTVERFYYYNRRGSTTSISTGTGRSFRDWDDHSVISESSHVSSMADDEDYESAPEIEIHFFRQGDILLKEGERSEGLYFVLDGTLEASTSSQNEVKNSWNPSSFRRGTFFIKPGGLAGYLTALTGNLSFVNIRAHTDVTVALMPKQVLDKYVDKYPNVLLCLANRLVNQLSPLVLHIDAALEWGQINAGQALCRQGDTSNSIYIVLNGRLRSIRENSTGAENSLEIQGEYGSSESVGEMEVLLDLPRPSTIHAIRDSEVAIMPKTLFNALAIQHPEITMTISRIIASRSKEMSVRSHLQITGNNKNLKTVCLLPVSNDVPIQAFADKLNDALMGIDGTTTSLLGSQKIAAQLGKHAFTRLGRLKLVSWLAEQEESHRIVLYVADGGVNSPWTQRCIRQADSVILVGLGDGNPALGEYEQLLLSMKTTARKELVLLHNERTVTPGTTAAWLKLRLWIHGHHHMQMQIHNKNTLKMSQPNKKQLTFGNLGAHFQSYYSNLASANSGNSKASPKVYTGARSDFSRLARRLLSKSIGLVLGGGGARGIAHVGVIRALQEVGIPIDMVGGTSMGAFVGGLYARENDHVSVFGRAKMLSMMMTSLWRQILDLTYPTTAMMTGHEFNRGIWKCFSDTLIEDCWLSFYSVTANITFSRMEVHQQGYLWRFVRASMSLSGYFPPMCDNGSMLMDGGYLNNVPADVMRDLGGQHIIAVDVGSQDDTSPVTYGDSLSGFWMMFNRINPFGKDYGNIPNLNEIQSRLAYASSVPRLNEVKALPGCHMLNPPVQGYKLTDFKRFLEIEQVGYEYCMKIIQKWNEDGTLLKEFGVKLEGNPTGRRASI
ncbi:hypothetical protein BC833DRAFT_604820 [Globomyces pollinis-pini]|nr:hypothetical protein BC833DRAFT_604820 [Globomyces pollinis-pini]